MSSDEDRISVPTNGKRPHSVPTMTAPTAAAAAPTAPPTGTAATAPKTAPGATAPGATRSSSVDLPGGLSPQQLAVGFGIIASLLAIGAGLARRRIRR
jgi:hypothetical protein